MASNTTTLPPWASSVVFSYDKITETLDVLTDALKGVAPKWWELGLQLGHQPASLDGLKANLGKASIDLKFEEMLDYWIQHGKDEYRTWGALAKAVDRSGNKALGNKVRKLEHYREHSRAQMEVKELANLLHQLTADWKALATKLGIGPSVIDKIDSKLKVGECLRSVLEKWIKDPDDNEEPSLKVLYKALESYGVANRALARKILINSEVMELLSVSEEEKDKENVEKQLKSYIADLKEETDGVAAKVDDLPAPPKTKPGAEVAKVLVKI